MRNIIVIFTISFLLVLSACGTSPGAAANWPVAPVDNVSASASSSDNDSSVVSDAGSSGNVQAEPREETSAAVEQEDTPQFTPTPLPDSWKDYPVIPNISPRALEIYQAGIESGNDPHAFSKIGDCQNITTYFLAPFEDPELHSLGEEYAYLQETIDYFYGSYSRESLAVAGGLNVARVLSPFHSDVDLCEPNEHPLSCEVRIQNPSIAIVSLEENWESRTSEEYEQHLRTVIDFLISENVLPILATKADNLEGDHSINKTIVKLAAEYQIPLWNFWRAVQPLPHHGLEGDGFHLTLAGPYLDQESNMKAAWPWRNLTALQSLEAVLEAVNGE